MSTLVNTSSTEISVVKQKYDELVKKSLLTRSQFEGQLKEKTKVISDLKVKEGKDIDTMIEMDKQIKFLNEILYKRNQSISDPFNRLAPNAKRDHVALDALKLTPFYNAFEISADVLKIYMQEFWVTVSRHYSSLHFKLNGKSHTVNVDNFRDLLKICLKLTRQIFEEPPLEEEILSFIRDLGHTEEIKFLFDVNVNHMHQPWRSFAVIINKCLSGKTSTLESL
ncbi:hypothetical protein Tco_1135137 [Tanacetum coccineum]